MRNKLKTIIERLLDKAKVEGWLSYSERKLRSHHPDSYWNQQKPGEYITSLSEEERQELSKVTPEDFNHRIDEAVFMMGRTPGRKGRLGKHLEEERMAYDEEQSKKELNAKRNKHG